MDGNEYINNQLSTQVDKRVEERLKKFQDGIMKSLNDHLFNRIESLNKHEANILHQISNLAGRVKSHQEFMDAFLVRFSIGFLLVMMVGGAIGAGVTVLLLQWAGYL